MLRPLLAFSLALANLPLLLHAGGSVPDLALSARAALPAAALGADGSGVGTAVIAVIALLLYVGVLSGRTPRQ